SLGCWLPGRAPAESSALLSGRGRLSLRREVFGCGALDDAALDVEARSMARAIPRPLRGVERQAASKVRACGGDGVQLSGFVAIGGHVVAVDVDDAALVVAQRVR